MTADPTRRPLIAPLLDLLPGMADAEVCGPDGCAPPRSDGAQPSDAGQSLRESGEMTRNHSAP